MALEVKFVHNIPVGLTFEERRNQREGAQATNTLSAKRHGYVYRWCAVALLSPRTNLAAKRGDEFVIIHRRANLSLLNWVWAYLCVIACCGGTRAA